MVKVIVDRHTSRIYFTQTRKWPLHFDFAKRYLSSLSDPVPGLALFNQLEYHSDDRRFILANVTHYLDADVWSLELFANDELAHEPTVEVFHAVQKLTFFGDRLRYRPGSEKHEHDLARVRSLMPVVTSDEIFGKIRYQPLELGEAYGYLRLLPRGQAPVLPSLRPSRRRSGTSTFQYYSRTLHHRTTPAHPHRDRKGAVSNHDAVTAPFRSRCGLSPHFREVRL